jgi:hypothetical protein
LIDLHTHTDRSDGTTDPGLLIRQARDAGIEALAIADHDTLAGYDAAVPFAEADGVELICAVELSTRPTQAEGSSGRAPSVHILGYWLTGAPTSDFRQWLETQQESRRGRNLRLVAKLRQLGLDVRLEEAEVYGRNQVGRPHFARVLLEKGYVSHLQEAFDVYLADDAQAAVEREEPSIPEGIQRIRDAGGIASLAHPVRLRKRGAGLDDFITPLMDAGLQGIEVYHSEHGPADCAEYTAAASRFGLIETGGSDYHGDAKPAVRLGYGIDGNVGLGYEFLEQMREQAVSRRASGVKQ